MEELGLPAKAVGSAVGGEKEHDAFQSYILGELPADRTLVGDGQSMGKEVVELFSRADAKLRVSEAHSPF